ncbi:MAG: hypothetical protein F6K39_28085 [Okeania sp. SIO3B3]|nr:hypothetical protein [Okeania sp. SIO3B3]
MVEGRQKAEGRGQKLFPIITLILYTNDATGHDITQNIRSDTICRGERPFAPTRSGGSA